MPEKKHKSFGKVTYDSVLITTSGMFNSSSDFFSKLKLLIKNSKVSFGTTVPSGSFHIKTDKMDAIVVSGDAVGIGTTDPKHSLHVVGNLKVEGSKYIYEGIKKLINLIKLNLDLSIFIIFKYFNYFIIYNFIYKI